MGRRYGAVTPRYACTGMLSCSMPKKGFNVFILYVFLFTNYLDFSVMEIFWPMQLSVYQGISASNVFGVVCLYNDEEFFMLFVHLFLFKLYLIDFSWDLNCITLLCALTRCSLA